MRDEHELLLPADMPEGEYELRVGMYILENMERLMIMDGEQGVEGEMILLGTMILNSHHRGKPLDNFWRSKVWLEHLWPEIGSILCGA